MDTETGVDNTKHKIHINTMVVNGESNKLHTPAGNVVDLTPMKKAHHPTLIYAAICRSWWPFDPPLIQPLACRVWLHK